MTSAFVDMALATDSPIVPVRFVGGLPAEPLSERIEFPIGMGTQDIYLGAPISPATFEALPYKERKHVVIDALNALGPANAEEESHAGDAAFDGRVRSYQAATGASHEHAALFGMLRERRAPGDAVARLLAGHAAGRLELPDSPVGRWLAELARRLYGERGGDIVVGAAR
jgi:hypothetical protein